ncbi:hypothetical protein RRU94_17955 [Domibacillus sp. DTU_2020_1001157_1_SI_ALB_TIR_016]|uniref:hypothetical protein n=1 Tax=Domibacillus sp. DTU_2020_1001157_1_SI_ALB_TIR_016 TaxID=3077789 RepID=UPI0028F09FC4|nr:hypothetical protein [Domibacillus sp. DTU_2020_1001157_1_SI_ALB_TIR_016]WNS79418.1 hypothetical protein RRU94_17955 [Domibacillus sp. DTU_2020_1001157_1_SI_ALB_TIR_016]
MSAEDKALNRSTRLFVDPFINIHLSMTGDKDVIDGTDAQLSAIKMLLGNIDFEAEYNSDPEASQKGCLSVLDEIGRLLRVRMDVFPKEQRNIEVVRNFLNAMLLSRIYEQESYQGIFDQDRVDDGEQPNLAFRP